MPDRRRANRETRELRSPYRAPRRVYSPSAGAVRKFKEITASARYLADFLPFPPSPPTSDFSFSFPMTMIYEEPFSRSTANNVDTRKQRHLARAINSTLISHRDRAARIQYSRRATPRSKLAELDRAKSPAFSHGSARKANSPDRRAACAAR